MKLNVKRLEKSIKRLDKAMEKWADNQTKHYAEQMFRQRFRLVRVVSFSQTKVFEIL